MVPIVKQTDITDCGIACIKSIFNAFHIDASMHALKLIHPFKVDFYSFQDLSEVAETYGIKATGYLMDVEGLKKIEKPVIAHVLIMGLFPHFVVVQDVLGEEILFMDPAEGKIIKEHLRKFEKRWSNKILSFHKEISNTPVKVIHAPDAGLSIKGFLINKRAWIITLLFILLSQTLLTLIIISL